MSMRNNTLKAKKNQYHHLTYDDRIKIEFMINEKDKNGKRLYSNTDIAKKLGVHKSTISRELKRIKSKAGIILTQKILCRQKHGNCRKKINKNFKQR